MTFQEWWDSGALDGDTIGKGGIRACVEKAWDAAIAAAARECELNATDPCEWSAGAAACERCVRALSTTETP
jgi:hypothetical protein